MKNQKINIINSSHPYYQYLQRVFLCSALLWVLTVTISRAQNLLEGSLQRVNYLEAKSQLFKIPTNTSANYLFLRAEGADGGRRYDGDLNINYANGGEGATIKAWFPIGAGNNQIPPGSDVCMIIGDRGSSRDRYFGMHGAGGGGGTGVLFRKPNTSKWHLLIVAGGGGGAVFGGSNKEQDGGPGNDLTYGTKNGGTDGKGGTYGAGEDCYVGLSDTPGSGGGGIYGAGGGFYGGAEGWSCNPDHASIDPAGGDGGGEFHIRRTYITAGGWGFGGGGSGDGGGGGGGGYSGGGGGDYDRNQGYSGGGGGSYVNEDLAVAGSIMKIKNGSTSSPGPGFVEYQLFNASGQTIPFYSGSE